MTRLAQTRIGIWPMVILAAALLGGLACWEESADSTTAEPARAEDSKAAQGAKSPEEITIRFLIAGLTTFVPSTDGTSLGVLVVDADQDFKTHAGCKVPRHSALLQWHAGSCPECPTDRNNWLHFLRREDIHFRLLNADSAPPALALAALRDPPGRLGTDVPVPPIGAEWLFHMGELFGDSDFARIKDECFKPAPDPAECPLAARLRLDHGLLRTCRFSAVQEELEGNRKVEKVSVFDFEPLPEIATSSFTPRPLAHALEVEWRVRATGLEVSTTRFGEEGETSPLKVTLVPTDDGEIVVGLFNRLPLGHAGTEEFPQPEFCDMAHADPHFDHFYRITKATPDPHPLPHHTEEFLLASIQPVCQPSIQPVAELEVAGSGEAPEDKPPEHSSCVPKRTYPHAGVEVLEP